MTDVAAFDFDGTLTNGGSMFAFLATVAGPATAVRSGASLAPRLARAAVVGGTAADDAKEALFARTLAGVDEDRAAAIAEEFARRHLARRLRGDVVDRLDWHRRRGDRVVVVSASPTCYVRPAALLLGADAVIATELATADGVLTGAYAGANCRGAEKLRRLSEWVAGLDEAPERLWAYGNSRGDARMLAGADVGVNVGRLGRFGRLRRFPGLDRGAPG